MKILEDKTSKVFATGYIALLIGAMAFGVTALPRVAHSVTTPLGIAIPLYTYPTDGTWSTVIQAKHSYPNVPFIAVVNPNSGPGNAPDANYATGIKNLQAAGVTVLGYVATGYASNSISSVEAQASSYHSWYGVNGIFFDEMSNSATAASYYSTLNTYVHSLIAKSTTVGNPGTSVPTALIGTLDILCVYESSSYPPLSFITYPGYNPTNFYEISYGVPFSSSFLSSLPGVISWVYTTDAGGSNPYGGLPSYFTSEVAQLSSIDGSVVTTSTTSTNPSTTTTSSTSSGTSMLKINTADTTGGVLTGYYTALAQNGQTVSTGYSPAAYTLGNGQSYVVESDGYGSCVFAYWLDTGSTNPQRAISISVSAELTAVLNCGTSGNPTSSISVGSVDLSGNSISGMWTTWNQNGAVLATGYTPTTFTGTTGGTYGVTVSNFGSTVFCNWQNGNTNPAAAVTMSGNLALTAVYSTTGSCPGQAVTTTTSSTSTSTTHSTTTTATTTTSTSVSSSKTTTSTTRSSSTTSSTTSLFQVTIKSVTTAGASLTGMYATVTSNSATLTTGFTPLTFTARQGSAYTVTVDDYGNYVFSHWSTASTSATITIAPTGPLTLVAYYNVVSCTPHHKTC